MGQYALISALEDDRFDPVTIEELPKMSIGLSLLVNFKSIANPLNWQVGKHGVEIDFKVKGRKYSSTFLPEVMGE